jgi:hypothetical protein
MAETIERGANGLLYLTDSDERALFITGADEPEVKSLATQARLALTRGISIHRHALHTYERGGRLFVPDPQGMTAEQRQETIDRLKQHLITHFNQ